MSEQLLLSKREAAAMLGLSVRTLENLLRLKELPSRRVGRRRLIERQALEKFAKRDHVTKRVEPFLPCRGREENTTPESAKIAPFGYCWEGDRLVRNEAVFPARKTKSQRKAGLNEGERNEDRSGNPAES